MPLKVKDGMGAWIRDFQDSKAKQFKGRSKDERRDQAIAAYLSAKRGPLKQGTDYDPDKNIEKDIKKRNRLMQKKNESSAEYAKSIERINKKKRDDLLKPGEKDKIDQMRKMMKKANEDIAGGLTRRIGSLSNVTGPNRSTALGQASKLGTQRSNIRAKNQAQRDIKKRMQMNSTNESIGRTPGDDSYHLLQKAKRMAAKDGHDYDKLPAYDRTHNKHRDYYDQKAKNESVKEGSIKGSGTDRKAQLKRAYRSGEHSTDRFYGDRGRSKANTIPKPKGMRKDKNLAKAFKTGEYADQSLKPPTGAERSKPQDALKKGAVSRYKAMKKYAANVKEGMTTGNEAGMMFRVKIEGLPDMIMVGRSPSDIKQQLRKIVKQPSMITSVDRMPKSQVRKMYRDLAGGKDIDENYLADYGSPESVKRMSNMTPGQGSAMLDKLMKRRKGKSKKKLGKNDNAED